jgi:hypothetical protein
MNSGGSGTEGDDTARRGRDEISAGRMMAIGRLSTAGTRGAVEVGLMPSHDAA